MRNAATGWSSQSEDGSKGVNIVIDLDFWTSTFTQWNMARLLLIVTYVWLNNDWTWTCFQKRSRLWQTYYLRCADLEHCFFSRFMSSRKVIISAKKCQGYYPAKHTETCGGGCNHSKCIKAIVFMISEKCSHHWHNGCESGKHTRTGVDCEVSTKVNLPFTRKQVSVKLLSRASMAHVMKQSLAWRLIGFN